MEESIMVAIRARPLSDKEKRAGEEVSWRIEDQMIVSTIHELEIVAAASAAFATSQAKAAMPSSASTSKPPSTTARQSLSLFRPSPLLLIVI